ncbi:adenosylhomocysteinase [Micromonospora zingiberis]|uniref:Adenosylhomocysteinase n=1 Tax=Micromonospora zingiberis TaxID=2053011 RepID=A0A4R0GQ18_9ACTN|nr:adenosylhomocysteinase [Micromonospora zingiberis]TCB99656.1 adenosylhomocysteinase [Micromonospora zingiberis]
MASNDEADYRIADLGLARAGRVEIRWAEHEMPGLMALRRRYAPSRPLAGKRISGFLALTVQTAVIIETLIDLGADVRWSGCNVLGTQDHAAAAVVVGRDGTPERPTGPAVFAWRGQNVDEYWWCAEQSLRWPDGGGPDSVIDDGGDFGMAVHTGLAAEADGFVPDPATARTGDEAAMLRMLAATLAERPKQWTTMVAGLRGVTEETTCGMVRLNRLHERKELLYPVININDAVTKSKYDNHFGCRHSLIDGINRATDVLIGGKVAVVVGYGNVGKGCAQAFRGQGARVVVVEIDPICALQAAMDGYQVTTLNEIVPVGDFFVTATGACRVIRPEHMARMKHLAIVGNIGHFDIEVDVAGLAAYPGIQRAQVKPQVDEWVFPDGHSVIVLGDGRVINFANATGHPSYVMSASFTNQVMGQLELYERTPGLEIGIHLLSRRMDEEVARLHLDSLGVRLDVLTEEQAEYLNVPVQGPFKSDTYRY